MSHQRLSSQHQDLIRRYLLWAYKDTKESFERIERKTTQLVVDEYLLKHLTKHQAPVPQAFRDYIAAKQSDELKLKFADGKKKKFNPQYLYLKNRLSAIEAAIKYFLGAKELKRFEKLFEEEFTRRILASKEH